MKPQRALLLSPMVFLLASSAFGANVEITSPASGARLTALITVTATVDAGPEEDLTPPVLQTIDGRQIPMVPESDEVYSAEVDTTTLPNESSSVPASRCTRMRSRNTSASSAQVIPVVSTVLPDTKAYHSS